MAKSLFGFPPRLKVLLLIHVCGQWKVNVVANIIIINDIIHASGCMLYNHARLVHVHNGCCVHLWYNNSAGACKHTTMSCHACTHSSILQIALNSLQQSQDLVRQHYVNESS